MLIIFFLLVTNFEFKKCVDYFVVNLLKKKNDMIIGIDTFGESGKGGDVLRHFGFDENLILNKILKKI